MIGEFFFFVKICNIEMEETLNNAEQHPNIELMENVGNMTLH